MKKFLLALLLLPSISLAEKAGVVGDFRGLHNSESSILINDNEAQDLQDVDFSDGAKGIVKRGGYSTYQDFGVSTLPVTGAYYFKDVDGDDTIIAANNGYVYKSQTGGTFSSFVTTDTISTFYDFADSQGSIWRATSDRDQIWSYDGATLTYYPSSPQGDQVEVLPDRLVISGASANPNRLHFSAAADFTNFSTDIEETSPFTEDIFLPGQNITAIKAACGGILAWSKDSMSFWYGTNQFDGEIRQISETIGTLQPSSLINDLGITYWQAQDGHFYSYDCNNISRISSNLDVSGFVTGSPKSWNQTAQSDWAAGTDLYTDSDISVGDVVLSTWTDTDSGSSDFSAGTTNSTSVIGDYVYLSTTSDDVSNNSFESGNIDNWTRNSPSNIEAITGATCNGSSLTPQDGSYVVRGKNGSAGTTQSISILDNNGDLIADLATWSNNSGTECAWQQKTANLDNYVGQTIKFRIGSQAPSSLNITSDSFFTGGGDISLYFAYDTSCSAGGHCTFFDFLEGGQSNISSGTFTSQSFDTNYSSAAWLSSTADWTTNGHTITIETEASQDNSNWETAVTWSTGSAPSSNWAPYIRYKVTFSTGAAGSGTGLPYFETANLAARSSTGTFTSQTKNIGANATSFGNFVADSTLNSGAIAYWMRTATTEGGLTSASWTALTSGSQIGATINPWIQVKAVFSVTDATYDPTLASFVVNWNEGEITRHWGVVDKDHRLIWSIAEGADTVPSVSYIFDQRFSSWLKYSFPFYAPARTGNDIYFGDPSVGTLFQYPVGTSDDGSAITAYWKSKDFVGSDPFVESDYNNFSIVMKAQTGSNIDFTYTVDTTSSTSTNYSLTDPNSLTIRRINDYFPSGTFGSFINFKFGNDDADAPFELYGFTYDYDNRPWRVLQ